MSAASVLKPVDSVFRIFFYDSKPREPYVSMAMCASAARVISFAVWNALPVLSAQYFSTC